MLVTVAVGAPIVPLLGAPYAYHAAPIAIAPAPVVETRVHYEHRPVVTGHTTQILKPVLGAVVPAPIAPLVKKVEELKPIEVKTIPLTYAAPVPLAYAAPAPVAVNIPAPIPYGRAPPMNELVTKEKVLAPVRTVSEMTQQITVQHPTKVNVEKVAVDVPVAQPYAHPVPVPVVPQVAVHHTPIAMAHPYGVLSL